MSTPEEIADSIILEGLRGNVALFVALQYRGLVDQAQLHALFGEHLTPPDPVAEILARGVAPEPDYAPPTSDRPAIRDRRSRRRGIVAFRGSTLGVEHEEARPRGSRGRSDFARWMEGEIPWTPAVMGWADDDPRADGWEDGRYD